MQERGWGMLFLIGFVWVTAFAQDGKLNLGSHGFINNEGEVFMPGHKLGS